jgi:hypothetical protein
MISQFFVFIILFAWRTMSIVCRSFPAR